MLSKMIMLAAAVAAVRAQCSPSQHAAYRGFVAGVPTSPCPRLDSLPVCGEGVDPLSTMKPTEESKCCVTCKKAEGAPLGGCTPEQVSEAREFVNGVPKNPCPRFEALEDCPTGVQSLSTISVESQCCPKCRPPPTSNGGSDGVAGGNIPTSCVDGANAAACRAKFEANTIPTCEEGTEPIFADCCTSCIKKPAQIAACSAIHMAKTEEQRRADFAALPECGDDEKAEFDATLCLPTCRPPARTKEECFANNGEKIKECFNAAPSCEAGNLDTQQVSGVATCCAPCKVGRSVGRGFCPSREAMQACRDSGLMRPCGADEVPRPSDDPTSCCPTCDIGKPVCEPACKEPNPDGATTDEVRGEDCIWQFNGRTGDGRTPVCAPSLRKKVCVTLGASVKAAKEALTGEALAEEIKALVAEYCSLSEADPICRNEARLNHVLLNVDVEKLSSGEQFCFYVKVPRFKDALTEKGKTEEAAAGDEGVKPAKRAEVTDDFSVVEAAVQSDYAQSNGYGAAKITDDEVTVSGAASYGPSAALLAVGAATAAVLLL